VRLTRSQVHTIIREEISAALKDKQLPENEAIDAAVDRQQDLVAGDEDLPTSLKEAFAIAQGDAPKIPALVEAIRLMVESAQMYVAAKPFKLSSGQRIPAGSSFITTDGWGPRSESGQVQVHFIPAKITMAARENNLGMKWMLQRGMSGESWYADPEVVWANSQPQFMKP
jgi:uncharacterized membrane protein YgcG